jgi:hypothetical protein
MMGGDDMSAYSNDEHRSEEAAVSGSKEPTCSLTSRRDLLMTPLLAALPLALLAERAAAAPDPNMTIVKLPDQITWVDMFNSGEGAKIYAAGKKIVSQANLYSETSKPGIYYLLIRWYPGFMSAPHWYETDRLCVVVSGTWWVNSGETFDPDGAVPAPAGTFVRRVAKTPHYDGVKADGKEPATIAICGIGPITAHLLEPDKPDWRQV